MLIMPIDSAQNVVGVTQTYSYSYAYFPMDIRVTILGSNCLNEWCENAGWICPTTLLWNNSSPSEPINTRRPSGRSSPKTMSLSRSIRLQNPHTHIVKTRVRPNQLQRSSNSPSLSDFQKLNKVTKKKVKRIIKKRFFHFLFFFYFFSTAVLFSHFQMAFPIWNNLSNVQIIRWTIYCMLCYGLVHRMNWFTLLCTRL